MYLVIFFDRNYICKFYIKIHLRIISYIINYYYYYYYYYYKMLSK
ncbi:MAG: hypothetical protein K7J15_04490 [Candidatus Regiella insecticola]|nr:hypothetical protein [Candidatus Regiella insecticola]